MPQDPGYHPRILSAALENTKQGYCCHTPQAKCRARRTKFSVNDRLSLLYRWDKRPEGDADQNGIQHLESEQPKMSTKAQ